ncbi:MAG: restriction endonuclease subunit S [Propylenella sp.]
MNAERLLTLYEKIADAPDAIPRLRRFVLDLAVRGKLVPQDPSEEPASELLKQIAAEKARLVKAGKIRKPKTRPAVDEAPFGVPNAWRWTRIREITSDRGQIVPDAKFTYIDVTAIDKEKGIVAEPKVLSASEAPSRARKITRKGDVIYSCVRPYLLNVAVIEEDFEPAPIASTAFAILDGYGLVLPHYLWIVLRSPFMVECVEANMRGQAYPAINDADFAVLPFPIPPLAEQHRIVAKVDELMALCDRLEAARQTREATRDRLTAASLARLNAPDPDTFRDDARFALDALPALTARADQIRQLRQTILNLAVRGKLAPQDPKDEPASELLSRIAAEFERLVRDGVLNKPKPVKAITDDDQLFPLPPQWALARFNQVASIQSNLVDPKRYKEMPHIAPDNIEGWTARLLPYVSIGEAGVFSGKHLFSAGAILYSKIRPNLAKVTKIDFDGLCSADMYPIHALIDADFLVKFMITPAFVSQAVSEDNRVAMPKINQAALSDIFVPVPPAAEQHRIVAKVDELLALCDRLEASLAADDETRRLLFKALLAEAFAPADARELEAAE